MIGNRVRPVTAKPTEDLRQEYESFGGVVTELPQVDEVRDLTTVILKAGTEKYLYKMVEGVWVLISSLNEQANPSNPVVPDSPVTVTEEHRGQAIYIQQDEPTDQVHNDVWVRY